jgi:D-amino peptidase
VKILIACDMEGITGVINWDQVNPAHSEYPRYRQLMTRDVNAAIEGAFEAGANEVVVTDGHAGGSNILLEELDPRAHLNQGNDAPFAMAQGIEYGADGVLFIGYHARAGSHNAILDHTWSSRCVHNLWINGTLTGEYGLNGALCGHYDAPVLMISGDQEACKQAVDLLGNIEVAVVKRATHRKSAELLPPDITEQLICEAAARAVTRLRNADVPTPYKVSEPVTIRIEFTSSDMADNAAMMMGVSRLDGRTVEFTAPEMSTAYRAFRAAVDLA